MKNLLVALLALPIFVFSQTEETKFNFKKEVKKVFKFSTFYGAVNGGTSISDDDIYSITTGQLNQDVIETPFDYSIKFGVRKIARFGYLPKEAFKKGNEKFYFGSNGKLIKAFPIKKDLPYVFGSFKKMELLKLKEVIDKSNFSVKNEQIECVYEGSAINFDPCKPTPPSQFLTPIQPYACGLMAWNVETFRSNMDKFGAAYHGGDAPKGYFTLKGLSTVDIDHEEDFQLAEVIVKMLQQDVRVAPKYYGDTGLTAVNG